MLTPICRCEFGERRGDADHVVVERRRVPPYTSQLPLCTGTLVLVSVLTICAASSTYSMA